MSCLNAGATTLRKMEVFVKFLLQESDEGFVAPKDALTWQEVYIGFAMVCIKQYLTRELFAGPGVPALSPQEIISASKMGILKHCLVRDGLIQHEVHEVLLLHVALGWGNDVYAAWQSQHFPHLVQVEMAHLNQLQRAEVVRTFLGLVWFSSRTTNEAI